MVAPLRRINLVASPLFSPIFQIEIWYHLELGAVSFPDVCRIKDILFVRPSHFYLPSSPSRRLLCWLCTHPDGYWATLPSTGLNRTKYSGKTMSVLQVLVVGDSGVGKSGKSSVWNIYLLCSKEIRIEGGKISYASAKYKRWHGAFVLKNRENLGSACSRFRSVGSYASSFTLWSVRLLSFIRVIYSFTLCIFVVIPAVNSVHFVSYRSSDKHGSSDG